MMLSGRRLKVSFISFICRENEQVRYGQRHNLFTCLLLSLLHFSSSFFSIRAFFNTFVLS